MDSYPIRVVRRDTNPMQTIALEVLAIIAAAVFVVMMIAIGRHRSSNTAQTLGQRSAVAEYLFALIPWLIMAAGAIPSLRRIAAGN